MCVCTSQRVGVLGSASRQLNEVFTCMATYAVASNKNANARGISGLNVGIFASVSDSANVNADGWASALKSKLDAVLESPLLTVVCIGAYNLMEYYSNATIASVVSSEMIHIRNRWRKKGPFMKCVMKCGST